MHIKNLNIEYFRNFDACSLEFDENINLLHGRNGSGKTNILEALFVLLLSKSPRHVADSILTKESSDYYRLEGTAGVDTKDYLISSAYQRGGRKKITVNKVPIKASELFERFTAVVTTPQDLEILSGPPSKRRDFLDIYLSQASVKYLDDLSLYHKVLAQKNAFLKQDESGVDNPYDELLIQYGSRLMLARRNFLHEIGRMSSEHYDRISGGQTLMIRYRPSVDIEDDVDDIGVIGTAFRAKLHQYKKRETIMQTSLTGPHRDEVEFMIRAMPARSHGSQGELRSAAVSVKLAVFRYLKQVKRMTPVLMLDEIFAELDGGRKDMLVEMFGEFGQIFITSASGIPEALEKQARKFRIDNGTVTAE